MIAQSFLFQYYYAMRVVEKLSGTMIATILTGMEQVYADIEQKQIIWKSAGAPACTDGCGECCVNFEPYVLENEALYLAAWLLDNDEEKANQIADGSYTPVRTDDGTGCFLFDNNTPYHCTVYDGRCIICRLFGYSGDYGKNGEKRYRPCKFLSPQILEEYHMEHRQYVQEELLQLFKTVPPAMSDCTEQALLLSPEYNGETKPLREALPVAIRKLKWLIRLNSNPNNDDQPASA